jgi:hypothetical protein
MGRPINKKYFGANALPNIKVHFHNGTNPVQGYVVKQKGAKKFQCEDVNGNKAICVLVDKAQSSLSAGEMSIAVKLDSGAIGYVTKISAHKITVNDASYPWNFSTSTSDGAAQVEEAGTSTTTISTATGATSFPGA